MSSNFQKFGFGSIVCIVGYIIFYVKNKKNDKINQIHNFYEMCDQYVICYKPVREDYTGITSSIFKFDKLGKVYKTECNYDTNVQSSYGFCCWTYNKAIEYAQYTNIVNYKIIKLKVHIDHMCILKHGKIRAGQLIITDLNV